MKRTLYALLFLLVLGQGPVQAQAQNQPLFSALDPIYNVACRPLFGASYSLANALDLGSFCRTYQSFRRFQHFGDYLQALVQGNISKLPGLLMDAALVGLNLGLNTKPDYQAFKDGFDKFMRQIQSAIDTVYNAPARLLDALTDELYAGVQRSVYNAVVGRSYTPPPSTLEQDLTSALPPVEAVPPELRDDFRYLDDSEAQAYQADRKEVARLAKEVTQEAAKSAAQQNNLAEAREKAQKAAEEARDQAEAILYESMQRKQAEVLQQIQEAATLATVDDPVTQQKGIAPKLREEARNALSDRRLLELQVEALASLIDQNAIYASKTAELLAETARAQLLTTWQIVQEVRKAQAQAEAAQRALSPEAIVRMHEDRVRSAIEAHQGMVEVLKAACIFYVGGESNKSLCD